MISACSHMMQSNFCNYPIESSIYTSLDSGTIETAAPPALFLTHLAGGMGTSLGNGMAKMPSPIAYPCILLIYKKVPDTVTGSIYHNILRETLWNNTISLLPLFSGSLFSIFCTLHIYHQNSTPIKLSPLITYLDLSSFSSVSSPNSS